MISKSLGAAFMPFGVTGTRSSRSSPGFPLKFWLGHSAKGMSDLCDKSSEDLTYSRDVAKSVGVGFELPNTLARKTAKPKRSKVDEAVLMGVMGRFARNSADGGSPC